MIGSVNLKNPGDGLYQSKDDGEQQNNHGYPEGVPLQSLPSVNRQLRDTFGFRLVKSFCYQHQAIVPVLVLVEITSFLPELLNYGGRIKFYVVLPLIPCRFAIPSFALCVRSGKKKRQCKKSFLQQVVW